MFDEICHLCITAELSRTQADIFGGMQNDGDSSPALPGCDRELLKLICWWENHSDYQCIVSVFKGAVRRRWTDCLAGSVR